MPTYGQFCPVAHALEILGDRWTLLIVRDMMLGTTQFNDLERGLPRISRGLLSKRLTQLQKAGIIEKRYNASGRKSTEYHLTEAGRSLRAVVESLLAWGTEWALRDPTPEELDSGVLMWWLRRRVNSTTLPAGRTVVQFDFYGAETVSFWLLLTSQDTTLCLTDPGFDLDLLVTADLATFFQVCQGPLTYPQALTTGRLVVDGTPALVRQFPVWFGWVNPPHATRSTHASKHTSEPAQKTFA